MKTRVKIFTSIITILVVALAAIFLLVFSYNNDSIEETTYESSLVAENMAAEKTILTPEIYYRIHPSPSSYYPSINNEFVKLTEKEFVYNGSIMIYQFKVKWTEGHDDILADINIQKKVGDTFVDIKKTEIDPGVMGQKVYEAGDYKIVVTLNNENYAIANDVYEYTFTIKPFVLNLIGIQRTEFIYNTYEQKPIIKFENDLGPAEKVEVAGGLIQKFNPQTNQYEEVDTCVNVGKYRIKYNFNNNNYIFKIANEEVNNSISFEIKPRKVIIKPRVESNIYTGANKEVVVDPNETLGVFGVDKADFEINSTYFYTNEEININNLEVENVKDVGDYLLKTTCNNQNYYVEDSKIVIKKKPIMVTYKFTDNSIYDGNEKEILSLYKGIYKEDNVKVITLFNGKKDIPKNAGIYVIGSYLEGNRKFNYDLTHEIKSITIQKAEYDIDSFNVEIHAIKVIVIKADFKGINVVFSIDNKNWQESPSIEALPMQDYTVYVKLIGDNNYNEKILTKDVRTGFDPDLFASYLAEVDIDNFGMKDVDKVKEIIRCKSYISEGDKPNINNDLLEKVETAYKNYKDKSQTVLNGALDISNGLKALYVTPITVFSLAVGALALRRKKNEK